MVLVNVNHKGGVGKTTNTIHIGAELNNRGKKVLLIDADNQCDLTAGVGIEDTGYSIVDFLQKKDNLNFGAIKENFHLLQGNPNFSSAKFNRMELKKSIEAFGIDAFYDYILIDVPPTGVNPDYTSPAELALCSTHWVIIPLNADMFSIKNVNNFVGKILELRKYNPDLKLLGLYFSNVLTTTNVFWDYYKILQEEQAQSMFKTYIRRDIEIVKASIEGKTIFEYNEKSRGAEDFRSFVSEIEAKITQNNA